MTTNALQTTQAGPVTEFQAVQGGTETASGPVLLVEAYVAIWIILLGFLLLGWRRQSRLEAKVRDLEQALDNARKTKKEAK